MVGRPRSPRVFSTSGHVSATEGSSALTLIDARVPVPRDASAAVAALEAKAGPAWTAVQAQAKQTTAALGDELSQLAGGAPPPAAVIVAELASRTLAGWRYVQLLAGELAGRRESSDANLDRDLSKLLDTVRQAAGLAVVARDLIVSSRDLAKDGAVAAADDDGGRGILHTLGIEDPDADEPDPASIETRGDGSLGSPQEPSSGACP